MGPFCCFLHVWKSISYTNKHNSPFKEDRWGRDCHEMGVIGFSPISLTTAGKKILNPPKALKQRKNNKLLVASSRSIPSASAFSSASVAYVVMNFKIGSYWLFTRLNGNGKQCRVSSSTACGKPRLATGASWGPVQRLARWPPFVPANDSSISEEEKKLNQL